MSTFSQAILNAKPSGLPRVVPGVYHMRVVKAGVKASARKEQSYRNFFTLHALVLAVLEDGTRLTLPPNLVVPPNTVGETISTVVELPGYEGYGFSEVQTMVKALTGMTVEQLGAPSNVPGQTVLDLLTDWDASRLSPVEFIAQGRHVVDNKTKAPRVDKHGKPFVKFSVLRRATAEETAKFAGK